MSYPTIAYNLPCGLRLCNVLFLSEELTRSLSPSRGHPDCIEGAVFTQKRIVSSKKFNEELQQLLKVQAALCVSALEVVCFAW